MRAKLSYSQSNTAKHLKLNVPLLMPDELILGLFGRFSLCIGFADYISAKKYLNNLFIDKLNKHYQYPLIMQLSDLLDMSLENIVSHHTLVPILRSLNRKGLENHELSILQSLGYQLAKPNVSFCEKCTEEDMSFLGFSYFRRSHQIHGIDICGKHKLPLLTSDDENAFFSSPDALIKNGLVKKIPVSINSICHATVQKYIELIDDYMIMQSPIDFSELSNIIKRQAISSGLLLNRKGRGYYLSDFIQENTPKDWLNYHFPCFKNKKPLDYFYPVDIAIGKKGNPTSLFVYLLVIANLIPDVDSQILKVKKTKNSNTPIPVSVMRYVYFKNSGDHLKTSENLNQPYEIVSPVLTNLGLPPLQNIGFSTRKALIEFFSGASILEILQRDEVDIDMFADVIRECSTLKGLNNEVQHSIYLS